MERYSRQLILEGFGEKAQIALSNASVLIIGAGGLGCPALQYLCAAGIGCIGVVDDDVVSLSNLHRQTLYTTDDIGQLKVTVALKRLKMMNPEIKINSYPLRLDRLNILDLFNKYDYILDGTDNFESRYLINDVSAMLRKPLIFAAVSGFEGQVAIFNVTDEKGLCCNYRDLFPIPPQPGEIADCAENGVLGILPGIIGTIAAAEVIKLITGIGNPLVNKLLHYNVLNQEQYQMNISPGNNYVLPNTIADFQHSSEQQAAVIEAEYLEIDVVQLDQLRLEKSVLMIDVRERHEFPVLNERIYKKIPISEFETFIQADIQEEIIVFICQHGIRSIAAAEAAYDKYGYKKSIYSVKGGIVKWMDYFSAL